MTALQEPRWRLVKLVRDDVAKFLAADATGVKFAPVPEQLVDELLEDKLVEEVQEFLRSIRTGYGDSLEDMTARRGEAADVYEALRTICHRNGIGMSDVAEEASVKRKERGGFGKHMGMWFLGRARNVDDDPHEDQRAWEEK